MAERNNETSLARPRAELPSALRNAVGLWADSTTGDAVTRRNELLHDKRRAVSAFFEFVGKSPDAATPLDVQRWRAAMEGSGLAANTIYARISRLSSFYEWAMRDPSLAARIKQNPVTLARPRRQKSYQTESTKAFTDAEMNALLEEIARQAAEGSVVAKRDYALMLIFFLTGLRRNEVITLRGRDVELGDDGLVLSHRQKGGKYMGRELQNAEVVEALLEYLAASDRRRVLGTSLPLWTRHDRAGRPGAQLSSHALDRNLKLYAAAAGVKDARLHRTRHTFARIVGETTGSMIEVQEALDHDSVDTTRAYVQRVVVKRDRHSASVATRLRARKRAAGD